MRVSNVRIVAIGSLLYICSRFGTSQTGAMAPQLAILVSFQTILFKFLKYTRLLQRVTNFILSSY